MPKSSSTKSTKSKKDIVGVGVGRKKYGNRSELVGGDEFGSNEVGDYKIGDNEVDKNHQKISKSKILSKSKKMVGSSDFLTLRARLAFTKLR